MKKAFRYSGNKSKFFPLFRSIPKNTKRIVELYLGGAGFSLNTPNHIPVLGFDLSPEVISIYNFLKQTTPDRLKELYQLVEYHKSLSNGKFDRDLNLPYGEQSYLKINVTSLVVGQLSSWTTYPKHKLPIEQTIECLDRLKNFEVRLDSSVNYEPLEGDLIFCDPPYINTIGNYSKGLEGAYKPQDTLDILNRTTNPIIFTYGSNAETLFPGFNWDTLKVVKVPDVRKGGVVERIEKVAYINWPEEESEGLNFT